MLNRRIQQTIITSYHVYERDVQFEHAKYVRDRLQNLVCVASVTLVPAVTALALRTAETTTEVSSSRLSSCDLHVMCDIYILLSRTQAQVHTSFLPHYYGFARPPPSLVSAARRGHSRSCDGPLWG